MNVFVNKQLLSYQNCFVVLSLTCHKNGLKAVFSFTDRQHAARQLSFESGPAVVCVDLLWCVWACYGVCWPAMVCVGLLWCVWTCCGVCGPAMVCVDLLRCVWACYGVCVWSCHGVCRPAHFTHQLSCASNQTGT